jgi:hypothetical protein
MEDTKNIIHDNPEMWMENNLPFAKKVDVSTFERFKIPTNVREWIMKNWRQIDDIHGTIYENPTITLKSEPFLPKPVLRRASAVDPLPDLSSDLTTNPNINWNIGVNMDETNKKAFNVLKTEGADAAFKYMTTDIETGRELDYSEIRARFG